MIICFLFSFFLFQIIEIENKAKNSSQFQSGMRCSEKFVESTQTVDIHGKCKWCLQNSIFLLYATTDSQIDREPQSSCTVPRSSTHIAQEHFALQQYGVYHSPPFTYSFMYFVIILLINKKKTSKPKQNPNKPSPPKNPTTFKICLYKFYFDNYFITFWLDKINVAFQCLFLMNIFKDIITVHLVLDTEL